METSRKLERMIDRWELRNRQGETFRFFRDETYKLRAHTAGLAIYEAPTTAIVGDLLCNDKQYFFSKGLVAPILRLESCDLKRVF